MLDRSKVKGLIFDYGGTIDSNGDHWSEVIWDGYCREGVPVTKAVFREAYVHAERALALYPYIQPDHTFLDLLRIKIAIQLDFLALNPDWQAAGRKDLLVRNLSEFCYAFAREATAHAGEVLALLAVRYPMVLVSNFYGNIETVLSDFGLAHFFSSVVESAVVGIRKPDPGIFAIGVERLGILPDETVVVGDSFKKDIEPAERLGCQTVWLKGRVWSEGENEIVHEQIINNFVNLKDILL